MEYVMDKKILLVEDNREYIDMLKKILSEHGYQVITAYNGEDGLEILKKDKSSIDIIITDLHMPGISGLEFAKEVFLKKITEAPIVILTTETSAKMKKEGNQAGIHHWIIKPIKKEIFLGTVDLIFKRYCQNQ